MRFEKINFNKWVKDVELKTVDGEPIGNTTLITLMQWYDDLKLPMQGAADSMGVDFYAPYALNILPHNKIKIPTGIRWVCDQPEDRKYGLLLVPRSGLGFKYGLRLNNTIGVIDSTYYESDNEGHIMALMENPSDEEIHIPQGKAFMQGLIVPYIIPEGASTDVQRNGGFGSTDKA